MKRISVIGVCVLVMALAGLCGCASSPKPASQPTVQATPPPPPKPKGPLESRLAAGMTMDQVRWACGNPKNSWENSDGTAVWDYNDAEKTLIPNYMLFGGTIHFVRVFFDMSGRVVRWSSRTHGRY